MEKSRTWAVGGWVFAALAVTACGPKQPPEQIDSILTPALAPKWEPLNVPQSAIELPAFMVGSQKQLSDGCWKSVTPKTGTGPVSIAWNQEKERELAASFQTRFDLFLVNANVDASVRDALKQSWKLALADITYLEVDPAQIRPDFTNEACTAAELDWFKDGRFVVTQGIKARKATISATAAADAAQQAKLDAAIQQMNVDLHTSFKQKRLENENLLIEAEDVFVGAIGTSLVAKSCIPETPFNLAAGEQRKLCDGSYQIRLDPAPVGTRYTLTLSPQQGAGGQFDGESARPEVFQLGELRIVFASVTRTDGGFRVDNLVIQLVGASG
ncbi:MAG TPA: hypothetical protein VGK73_14555 [Polyangiaceae bacterium]